MDLSFPETGGPREKPWKCLGRNSPPVTLIVLGLGSDLSLGF